MLLNKITDYLSNLVNSTDFINPASFEFQIGPQQNFQERIVKKVLVTQYITKNSVLHAEKTKCNLIICRNGLPCENINRIDQFSQKYILLILKAHLMVCILPPCWNNFPKGPVDILKQILSMELYKPPTFPPDLNVFYQNKSETSFTSIIDTLHRNLNQDFLQIRPIEKTIHRIAIKYPTLLTSEDILKAKYETCDCVISSGIFPEDISSLEFYNMGYIQIPMYYLVESALKHLCSTLAVEFPRTEFEFFSSDPIIFTSERKSLRQF